MAMPLPAPGAQASLESTRFDPFRPQDVSGLRLGGALSMAVHLGLVAVLAALVWRSAPPVGAVAELWSALPSQAAPALVEQDITPPPPAPAAEPDRREAAAQKEVAAREADIALKKAREAQRRERELEQRRRESLERERAEREREKEKAARDRREKAEHDKARREKAERERQDKLDREKAERQKLEREKADRERTEKLRKENLARMQGLAGASGGPEASGSATQSSGPSAGYAGRIRARIKPLIVYPDAGAGNPVAEVEVRLSPTGVIIGSRLLRRSGVAEWDAAVLRAVEKAEVLPKDVDGRVPSVMVLVFSPRE